MARVLLIVAAVVMAAAAVRAVVMAAATARSDEAQDDAVGAIRALAYSGPTQTDLGDIRVPASFLADKLGLSGCIMTNSRVFKLNPDTAIIYRVTVDLTQDDYTWVERPDEPPSEMFPLGRSVWALVFTAGTDLGLLAEERDVTEMSDLLDIAKSPFDPIYVMDLVDEFETQVPIMGIVTTTEIVLRTTPDFNRVGRLKTALDDYVSDWCR